METPICGVQTLSRLLNDLTPRRINQLVAEGVMPRPNRRDEYEIVACVRGYVGYLQKGSEGDALSAQRARLAKAKADYAEMESAQLSGDLVPHDQVERVWLAILNVVRVRLLGLPAKLAARVRMASTTVEVAAILRKEVHELLEEVSITKVSIESNPAGIDKSDAGGDGDGSAPVNVTAAKPDNLSMGG